EYTGQATTDYRGIVTPAGKSVRFGYSKFFAPIDWTIRFYKWSKSANEADVHAVPDEAALQAILKGEPLKVLHNDRLDFAGSSFDQVTGNDHFITAADGKFTIQPGDYTLELTSDDGARLWLDGKPLIEDAWHYQGPTLYSRNVHLTAGEHTIRVEHFQIDGYAALKVNLRPKT
ncbi:MAG: PA14 domain-containing protein, partial [Fimbriimonadales bacterium]